MNFIKVAAIKIAEVTVALLICFTAIHYLFPIILTPTIMSLPVLPEVFIACVMMGIIAIATRRINGLSDNVNDIVRFIVLNSILIGSIFYFSVLSWTVAFVIWIMAISIIDFWWRFITIANIIGVIVLDFNNKLSEFPIVCIPLFLLAVYVKSKIDYDSYKFKKAYANKLEYYKDNIINYSKTEDTYLMKKNSKYGFMKRSFRDNELFVFQWFEYDDAKQFSEGLAAVKKNNRWGFINKDNFPHLVIPLKYLEADSFKDGRARVKHIDGKIYYINKQDKIVYPYETDEVILNHYDDNFIITKKNGRYGAVYSKDYHVAIQPSLYSQFDIIAEGDEHRTYIIRISGARLLVDGSGNTLKILS
jgi:KWG repeat domain protein